MDEKLRKLQRCCSDMQGVHSESLLWTLATLLLALGPNAVGNKWDIGWYFDISLIDFILVVFNSLFS